MKESQSRICGKGPVAVGVRKRQEYPAAFLAPLDDAGVGQDAQVARHARLALPKHLRQFANRQFHVAKQRQDAQPAGIGKRLKYIGEGQGRGHQITI